jgi:hypothetical protein
VIGSPGSEGVGAVFVYDLQNGRQLAEQILPEAALEGDDFGSAVTINKDLLVVGSPLHEAEGFIAGAAFVYHRDASTGAWREEAILASEIAGDLDYFGSSLAAESDRIAVGSPGDDSRSRNAGAVYVYSQPDLGWALEEKLVAPDTGEGDRCGTSVALDGERVLIGCPYGFGSDILSGAAYLFRKSAAGYVLEYKFIPQDGEAGQLFGSSVALSGDQVFVGAPGPGTEYPDGSVHIFRAGDIEWQAVDVLSAGDRVASRGFGAVLTVDDDVLVVGAQRMEGEHLAPGSVYVFALQGQMWQLQTRLMGNDVDRADGFGSSVAVKNGHVLVGAAGDAEGGSNAGAAYHFKRDGATWN